MKKLVFLVNDAEFFVSHRLNLAIAAKDAGYVVVVACPNDDKWVPHIEAYGLRVIRTVDARSSRNLLSILRLFRNYQALISDIRPDAIHLITSKPIIFGGIASRFHGFPVVAAVSGLGYIFTSNRVIVRLVRPLVALGYRLSLNRKAAWVIFQNETDRGLFRRYGITKQSHTFLFKGSGVDLKRIKAHPETSGPIVVLLPARILRDKGIAEFIEAARLLKPFHPDVVFRIQGKFDPANPSGFTEEEVETWKAEGVVEIAPHSVDIDAMLAAAHIIALPSYREGFPKSLVDAAAAGRPAVTTDVPGCRDAVIPGQTGLVVPVRSPKALAVALASLIEDRETRITMGRNARRHAERYFDMDGITRSHLAVYAEATAA